MGFKKLVVWYIAIILCGLCAFTNNVLFDWFQTGLPQTTMIINVLLLLIFCLVNFVLAVMLYSRYGLSSFKPFVLSVVIIIFVFYVSGFLSDWVKGKRLDFNMVQYNQIIEQYKSDNFPESRDAYIIVPKSGYPACKIFIYKTSRDNLVICFHTGGGFPVKHWGYLYVSKEPIQSQDLSYQVVKIKSNWYRFFN
jgi:hypothetical protein